MTRAIQPADTTRSQRVLIAGGQMDLRQMITSTLRMSGYQVVSAESDHTVFSLAQAFQPDLIIVDFKCSRLNPALAQKRLDILSRFSNIPVIVISTQNDPNLIETCIRAGAKDFLAMPFTTSLLMQRVSQLVA